MTQGLVSCRFHSLVFELKETEMRIMVWALVAFSFFHGVGANAAGLSWNLNKLVLPVIEVGTTYEVDLTRYVTNPGSKGLAFGLRKPLVPFLSLTSDGKLKAVPKKSDKGYHDVIITVADKMGDSGALTIAMVQVVVPPPTTSALTCPDGKAASLVESSNDGLDYYACSR